MPQLKTVVIQVNDQTFLTSTWSGETVDALLQRLKKLHGTAVENLKLFVISKDFEGSQNLTTITQDSATPFINHFEEFNCTEHPWLSLAFSKVDSIILSLRPSIKSLMHRKVVLEYLKKNLSKCLGARVFCIGSSMNNVLLPDETIEVTPFLCKGQEEKWFLRINEGLCSDAMANGGYDNGVEVSSVSFNCKNATVSAIVNGMNVTIVHNELLALYNGAVLEDISHLIGKDGLIKRSLLLVKSWCFFDSPQYSHDGKGIFPRILPPRVLHIMVLHLFCMFGDIILHPLNALVYFLFYYGNVSWHNVVISLGKPKSPIDLSEVPFTSVFASLDVSSAVADVSQRCAETSHSQLQRIGTLISNYRLRYEATVAAGARAKEEDAQSDSADIPAGLYLVPTPTPGQDDANCPTEHVSGWGMAPAYPSLTPEYEPEAREDAHDPPLSDFNRSHMNVADCMRPDVNLTAHVTVNEVEQLTQLLRCGLHRFALAMQKCRSVDPEQYSAVPLGMDSSVDIATLFVSDAFGNTHDTAMKQELTGHSAEEDAALDELKLSKFFCELEDPESVMRHAELIMGSKITADAVASLIVHIVEQAGPHPIGEIGKLLQEATGNPNLSRVLKSQFRGLKKLIEGYPNILQLGGDHSFNPHVYLVDPSPSTDPRSSDVSTGSDGLPRTRGISPATNGCVLLARRSPPSGPSPTPRSGSTPPAEFPAKSSRSGSTPPAEFPMKSSTVAAYSSIHSHPLGKPDSMDVYRPGGVGVVNRARLNMDNHAGAAGYPVPGGLPQKTATCMHPSAHSMNDTCLHPEAVEFDPSLGAGPMSLLTAAPSPPAGYYEDYYCHFGDRERERERVSGSSCMLRHQCGPTATSASPLERDIGRHYPHAPPPSYRQTPPAVSVARVISHQYMPPQPHSYQPPQPRSYQPPQPHSYQPPQPHSYQPPQPHSYQSTYRASSSQAHAPPLRYPQQHGADMYRDRERYGPAPSSGSRDNLDYDNGHFLHQHYATTRVLDKDGHRNGDRGGECVYHPSNEFMAPIGYSARDGRAATSGGTAMGLSERDRYHARSQPSEYYEYGGGYAAPTRQHRSDAGEDGLMDPIHQYEYGGGGSSDRLYYSSQEDRERSGSADRHLDTSYAHSNRVSNSTAHSDTHQSLIYFPMIAHDLSMPDNAKEDNIDSDSRIMPFFISEDTADVK